jgi:hypothetical protein
MKNKIISSKNDPILAELAKSRCLLKDKEFELDKNELISKCSHCNNDLIIPYIALEMYNLNCSEEFFQEVAKKNSWQGFYISNFGGVYCDGHCYHRYCED